MLRPSPQGSSRLRIDVPHVADGQRWAVGVAVASKCDRATAALATISGAGLGARAKVVGSHATTISRGTTGLFDALSANTPCAVATLTTLRTQLAEIEAALVLDLLDSLGISPSRVLAVGVCDPGLWNLHGGNEPSGYLGLCDPARLAEATGLNVIDAFPARDLAAGGQGGPLTPLAEWILLRDSWKNRVLLDLGRTIRLGYLPAENSKQANAGVLAFELGPGLRLLDLLAERLTGGQHPFDPGGRLAVQGRRIPELLQHWLSDPYFDCPSPRWHPHGVRPERFLTDAVQMAVVSDWSVRDLLCTATHFMAEIVLLSLRRRLPDDAVVDEIVVTGGGQHNGMLLHEIGKLTGLPLMRLSDVDVPIDALDAASAALLGLLHLDQIPANLTSITKAVTPRLLGRLTGGSPQNWQWLLETCTESSSALRPLRTAV